MKPNEQDDLDGFEDEEEDYIDQGFGPDDYARTMGLNEDPDWAESYNFDDLGDGDS